MEVCERFKEFRDRNRCVVYFPNTHNDEEPEAYSSFLAMMRVQMGIMILAPDREERFEPVYRDALKYHLQTIRHSRLFTSYVPIKTRVYFVETIAVRDAFYACADFCVPGGTLSDGPVDLESPIRAGCPILFGPKMADTAERRGLLQAGGARYAASSEEIAEQARDWLKDPASAKEAADKAKAWWQAQGRSL
ncbi:3-deoxy-D-manno-octulosonic acid transferase [Acidithiobacillus sp. CV18-2]|uniref:3-deoxy-D-manno-octulosonic acid transferase n=1 Tax=Igneacidithiobacillus copahuensis TaxID=2724909 RepID=A0AAE3CIG7_9PROT|nr:3-deoxy-D-manno-octulosonic acid transferase [Igneacidithiobacillus copahuensis]MBU2753709.1 3-deoxy-D-manno-octulosonic acid transferase [Acidithiobacillus sp. CV18-3]MBU2758299.1 3-deoxy-D-manno-octulosonic acid transferase [Acidithiobacillus sp. BN09-2]MBU2778048.1 3-deoxy-D-manno-octulosonic acid transferase [Acidithiobacillus sp. CV18-2]MBU2796062.1 3-deoxy-D-manno-octulosonic acid transferase [Acidithiobacillus sp. VAN18-2]MBU2798015.1 3-deoxy-D-manno-octulosonic acid transferase [Aci